MIIGPSRKIKLIPLKINLGSICLLSNFENEHLDLIGENGELKIILKNESIIPLLIIGHAFESDASMNVVSIDNKMIHLKINADKMNQCFYITIGKVV
jgi:hypothetical protein